MSLKPKPIVLIHGLWVSPSSWDNFRRLYEARGHRVLVPPCSRFDGDAQKIRRDPTALAGLGVIESVEHYESIVRQLEELPILMGHSFGGLIVQMLLDRGLGAAGVAIASAAPKGITRLAPTQLRSASPVLANPANYWRTVALTIKQFRYAFANTMTEDEARLAYEQYAIPGPGRVAFQGALANLTPRAATEVNYTNDRRAPLLLIAGGEDHVVPLSVNRDNYHKYFGSKAITSFREFPGRSHLIIAEPGWREVAEFALFWSKLHTQTRDDVRRAVSLAA
jgi:pimeloyl-ACP methyl ester carboxylesterase